MDGIQTVTITAWTVKFGHPIQLKAVQMMHLMKLCIRNVLKDHVIMPAMNCTRGGTNFGQLLPKTILVEKTLVDWLLALHRKSARMKWIKLW